MPSQQSFAELKRNERAAAINFLWKSPSYSNMTWLTRDVVITKSADTTYFSIIGNNTPPFYLGVQDFDNKDRYGVKKVAIFSAWDTYENNNCTTCGPESRPTANATSIVKVGPGVTPGQFGYEGTGVNAFINDFGWKVGDRVRAVVNLRPVDDGTEISAALQLNDSDWRYFGTFKYSKKYLTLEPGYSFIEDFGATPTLARSAEFGNTWMEREDLSVRVPINSVSARTNPGFNAEYHQIKQLNSTGLWGQTGSEEISSENVWTNAKIDVPETYLIPLEARIATLNLSGEEKKKYETQYLQNRKAVEDLRLEQELKVKRDAEIKAYGPLDRYAIYFNPDPFDTVTGFAQYSFNYSSKRIKILESQPGTNYVVHGSYGRNPEFIGGVQETLNGTRRLFLSAYHLNEATCKVVTCNLGSSKSGQNVEIASSGIVSENNSFTSHLDLYSKNLNWSIGDEITWLSILAPEETSSLLSIIVKVGSQPWQHFVTLRYPAIYSAGLSGGYSSIEEPQVINPFGVRRIEIQNAILETYAGQRYELTDLYLIGPKDKNRHSFTVKGNVLSASVGIAPQETSNTEYRLILQKSTDRYNFDEGRRLGLEIVDSLSDFAKKSRETAELSSATNMDKNGNALASKKKMRTITCVKGKKIRKVSGESPKCPSGYKKR